MPGLGHVVVHRELPSLLRLLSRKLACFVNKERRSPPTSSASLVQLHRETQICKPYTVAYADRHVNVTRDESRCYGRNWTRSRFAGITMFRSGDGKQGAVTEKILKS
jgi:hypothetical protein